MIPLIAAAALAADLEGNPTFGQYPGTAGLLARPSRLGWEADPLVAVGASLDVGAPELDLSARPGAWTPALVLALPADVDFEAASEEGGATRELHGGSDPWIGVGVAKVAGASAFGVSLILDLALDVRDIALDGFTPEITNATPSSITWDGDVPSRGEGNAGRVYAQDLDLALTGGFARIDGDTRPRVDVVGRWLRTGEHVRVASAVAAGGGPVASVDSVVGANPAPFWGLPNRSAGMLGAVAGIDRGGSLRDPRLRLEAAIAAGRTWPTFGDTRIVAGRYTEQVSQARITYRGGGARLDGGIGATWGWVADERDDGGRPGVRVRAGWRLDGLHELHAPETCVEAACSEVGDRTVSLRLTAPTAIELRVSERVTTSAGLLPRVHGYRWHRVTRVEGGAPAELMEQELVVGLGVRAGVRYEHRGWMLGGGFGTSTAGSAGLGSGGFASAPPFDVTGPPLPDSGEVSGPALALSPRLWIGWRPGTEG